MLVQNQTEGTIYTLHHSAIHSNYAPPNTISLVLSGPAMRKSFRIVDKKTKEQRVRFGAKDKPGLQERGESKIDRKKLTQIVSILKKSNIIH